MAELLLGSCNLMRAERPHDRTLARVCVIGNLLWLALMTMYALSVPAPVTQAIQVLIALVLLLLSSKTLRHSRPL